MTTTRFILALSFSLLAACFADATPEEPGIVSASPTEAASSGEPSSSPTTEASDGSAPSSDDTTSTLPETSDASTSSGSFPATGSDSTDASSSSTDDDGETTTETPTIPSCCGPLDAPGCDDRSIESCVCRADPYCCTDQWDLACAVEAEDLGCGECGDHDEVASCFGLCTTFVMCAPELGHDDVDTCVELECLGLLDQAQGDGDACLQSMTLYNACIGLLDCPGFDAYVAHTSPFPCESFESDMFAACPFIHE